jgi:hypothetical protein
MIPILRLSMIREAGDSPVFGAWSQVRGPVAEVTISENRVA